MTYRLMAEEVSDYERAPRVNSPKSNAGILKGLPLKKKSRHFTADESNLEYMRFKAIRKEVGSPEIGPKI